MQTRNWALLAFGGGHGKKTRGRLLVSRGSAKYSKVSCGPCPLVVTRCELPQNGLVMRIIMLGICRTTYVVPKGQVFRSLQSSSPQSFVTHIFRKERGAFESSPKLILSCLGSGPEPWWIVIGLVQLCKVGCDYYPAQPFEGLEEGELSLHTNATSVCRSRSISNFLQRFWYVYHLAQGTMRQFWRGEDDQSNR